MRLIKDSRSRPSWTLTLAIPACVGITVWFLAGGVDVTYNSVHVLTATKTGSDYAAALAPWIALLCNRQWAKRSSGEGETSNGT